MAKVEVHFRDLGLAKKVYGRGSAHLRYIADALELELKAVGETVVVGGDKRRVRRAEQLLRELYALAKERGRVDLGDIEARIGGANARRVVFSHGNRRILAKTENQQSYVDSVLRHDIVFGIGPAGTGKTYLAMAMAASALLSGEVKRIVLVRPAVEAGEKLGFLPGDMAQKVNPYLRPLYDALYDMVDLERVQAWISQGTIEVAPLAFMRGRTLNQSFVLLDEAQNTTREQMKMFLTRLGFSSKAIVTGDLTQTDLEPKIGSGLAHVVQLLDGVDGVGIVRLQPCDIVRHPLVQRIVEAYESEDLRLRLERARGGGDEE